MAPNLIPRIGAPYLSYHDKSDLQSQDAAVFPRQLQCGYRSKVCTSFRACKRNGSLHRFCEAHRRQANINQKKWVRRRVRASGDENYGIGRSKNSFQDLLAACSNADDVSSTDAVEDQARREAFQRDWVHSDPQRAVFPLFGSVDDIDFLWGALGLSELPTETEFVL
jgi:hypothetical protein